MFVSLKGRLQPRVAALRAAGIKPLFKEHQHLVVMASGAEFEQFLERARTEEGSSSRSCEESSVQ